MIVGIVGPMGSGKSLLMTSLGVYFHVTTGAPITANYWLTNEIKAGHFSRARDIWKFNDGFMLWDEIQLTMDSRSWKFNQFTDFLIKVRKKNIILFWASQHPMQVDVRIRRNTDYMMKTELKNGVLAATVIDYQYQKLLRKVFIERPERFYYLYNSYEDVSRVDTGRN